MGPFLSAESLIEESPRQYRLWIIIALLVLLWHLLFFVIPWHDIFPLREPLLPPRIEVQEISPEKLNQMKRQWREKQLLISPDEAAPIEQTEKPKDAKYFSDRNRLVEREQRAREAQVMPKPGAGLRDQQAKTRSMSRPKAKPRIQSLQAIPQLKSLGLPFRFPKPGDETPREIYQSQEAFASAPGAQQSLDDRFLPTGAQNMLNSEQSIFYTFYARIYQAIGPVWESRIREVVASRRLPPGDYITQVDAVLDSHGKLRGLNFVSRSNVREFDMVVDETWRKIDHFPNPPKELLNPEGEVHTGWTFTVHLSDSYEWHAPPPSRDY